jgi:hypothetical protein
VLLSNGDKEEGARAGTSGYIEQHGPSSGDIPIAMAVEGSGRVKGASKGDKKARAR